MRCGRCCLGSIGSCGRRCYQPWRRPEPVAGRSRFRPRPRMIREAWTVTSHAHRTPATRSRAAASRGPPASDGDRRRAESNDMRAEDRKAQCGWSQVDASTSGSWPRASRRAAARSAAGPASAIGWRGVEAAELLAADVAARPRAEEGHGLGPGAEPRPHRRRRPRSRGERERAGRRRASSSAPRRRPRCLGSRRPPREAGWRPTSARDRHHPGRHELAQEQTDGTSSPSRTGIRRLHCGIRERAARAGRASAQPGLAEEHQRSRSRSSRRRSSTRS